MMKRAVVVGNSFILYSIDGFKTWKWHRKYAE